MLLALKVKSSNKQINARTPFLKRFLGSLRLEISDTASSKLFSQIQNSINNNQLSKLAEMVVLR